MHLVGREVSLRAGRAALRAAIEARGGLILVTGEAGIGKTSLARALADDAVAQGFAVQWGACWEGAGTPLAPWLQVLRTTGGPCAAIAARLDDQRGSDETSPQELGERSRDHLFAEVVDGLRLASATTPQLVVLEDLHWADTASRLLLQAVAAASPSLRLVTIATCRDDELPADDALLALGGGADRIALQGLDAAAVAALLDEIATTPPTFDPTEVHKRTGGNPLFVTQLARLVDSGSSGELPAGVRDVLARRLARLSSACNDALGAAAVLGQEFEPRTVAAMLDKAELEILTSLDEAARARIAEPSTGTGTWTFAHALVQATRYQALGSMNRAQLHSAACHVLSETNAAASTLAFHAARGASDRGDPEPATLSIAAGAEALQRFAVDEALEHFERALEQAPPGDAGEALRGGGLLGIGSCRLRRGDDLAAGDAFEQCAAVARASGDVELLARAALGFGSGLSGFEVRMQDPRQLALLEEATQRLPDTSALRAPVLARLSLALWSADTTERRLTVANEALALARTHGDMQSVAIAQSSLCEAWAGPEHVGIRLELAGEIIAIGRQRRDPGTELLGRRLRALAMLERCDMAGFDAEVDAFERTADRLADALYSWFVPLWRGMRALADGRIAEARSCGELVGSIGREAGSTNAAVLAMVQGTYTDAVTEDRPAIVSGVDGMLGLSSEALVDADSSAPMGAYMLLRLGDQRGRPLALRVVERATEIVVDAEWLAAMAPLVDLAHELDRADIGRVLGELLTPHRGLAVIEGIGAALRGPVDRWLALLAALEGDEAAALDLIDSSLELSSRMGTLVFADAQHAAAMALRRLDVSRWEERADALDAASYEAYLRADLPPPDQPVLPRAMAPNAEQRDSAPPNTAGLAREGDMWAATWGGLTVRVRHVKGVGDLAMLLSRPGREVHVRELAGVSERAPRGGSQAPVLDDTAVRQYRTRLADLEEELDEADRNNDTARSERLAGERDALVEELTGAFGLGGRARELGSNDYERLRKAVTARIRAAIERMEALHPALGRHLSHSVRTGLWCSYQPEQPTVWTVDLGTSAGRTA